MHKTIAVLAHVDAGKTSFSEQVLYRSGAIRTPGRVDHRNAFLDLHPIERERGVTVLADQAVFDLGENRYYWLDAPGHVDFSSEMERALSAADFAVLVVSCTDGVESHTETIWQLLERYQLPVLLFVNKLDRPDADFAACLASMRALLSTDVVDLRGFDGRSMDDACIESVAERDEALLDRLMEDQYDFEVWRAGLACALRERRIFPAFGGSALTGEGVDAFLSAMDAITDTDYDSARSRPFAARVYKIRHDESGARELYFKVLDGAVRVRDSIDTPLGSLKINDLRLRHGGKSLSVDCASAGDLVYTSGLSGVRLGDGLGALCGNRRSLRTEPMMAVSVRAEGGATPPQLLQALRMLEEEDDALGVECDPRTGEMSLRVMGGVQREVLARLLSDRFGLRVSFGAPRILYMETIAAPAVGVGHYEPLKHYAEVWLRLSPGAPGSGICFESKCSVDELSLNWQRLIETHVFERSYPGVRIGAPLTDVRIELLAGRAHLKHTEGGDFREATCRAIRCALMYAGTVLLEPVCRFHLRLPAESYGRVAGDLNRMGAEAQPPESLGEWMRLEGVCPYRSFAGYPETFRALTHGRGSLRMELSHYAPAPNAAEVTEAAHYNPREADTPDSVFCSHGAGHVVPWNEARACAHCAVEFES